MKFFQKLLLAPAALGLLAPLAANANESNFRDVTNYSQDQVEVSLDTFKPLSSKNPLLAGGEGTSHSNSSDFDEDSFSPTTSASFTSNFAIGKEEGGSTEEYIANFDYEIALTTSFTGNDSLDVVMEAGQSAGYTELDMTNNSKVVTVDSISYTTSLGDKISTYIGFGDGAAGSSLYNTACVYGAQADTFSDCGVANANIDESLGTALGASFDFGNGVSAALGYEGQGGTTNGFAGKEGIDAIGFQVAYSGDSYGVSVSYANIQKDANDGGRHVSNQSVGFNAYFAPDLGNFPSISAGLESTILDDSPSVTDANDKQSHYFVGLQ